MLRVALVHSLSTSMSANSGSFCLLLAALPGFLLVLFFSPCFGFLAGFRGLRFLGVWGFADMFGADMSS